MMMSVESGVSEKLRKKVKMGLLMIILFECILSRLPAIAHEFERSTMYL